MMFQALVWLMCVASAFKWWVRVVKTAVAEALAYIEKIYLPSQISIWGPWLINICLWGRLHTQVL